MATRGLIYITNEKNEKIIEIYNHGDSYPSGLGKILKDFLKDGKLVNGISLDETNKKVFNGIEDFAAQLVCHLKNGIGGVYLYAPSHNYRNKKKYWEMYFAEYAYEINSQLNLRCWDCINNKEIDLSDI